MKIIEYNGITICRWNVIDYKNNRIYYKYVSPRVNEYSRISSIYIDADTTTFEEDILEELYLKYNKAIDDKIKKKSNVVHEKLRDGV
jgi:hypothetical protein